MPSLTKDDTVHSLKNSVRNVSDAAGEMKDDICVTANKAGHKVRDFINSASEELSHATETVTTEIKGKPVQSSLIALGIGFVLGTLLSR